MWKNININKQNVKADSGKAVLIAMPHSSEYDGFSFWHPSKLVREGRNSYALSIGYTDDFKFRLVKYGKGKWNSRDIIEETEIGVEEFEEAFGVINENITSPKPKINNEYETHMPDKVEAVDREALDELKDE